MCRSAFVVLLLLATVARADDAAAPRAVSLDDALAAVGQAPEHLAAAADTEATISGALAAGVWPGTTASVATARASHRLVLGLSLPLPLFGTLAANRATAGAQVGVARAEQGAVDLELRHRVQLAWLELARREARALLAEQAAARAEETAVVAKKRFDAGDVARADTVSADAAAARARADVAVARRGVGEASAQLAAVLGWDPTAALSAAGGLAVDHPEPPPLAELRARVAGHPAVRAEAARIDVADKQLYEADLRRWPELSLDFEADAFDPTGADNDFKIGVSLTIPLGGRVPQARDAARQTRRAAALRRDAKRSELDGALVAAYRRWQAATERAVALEHDVVPAFVEAARLSLVSYQEGEGSVTAVLEAARALIDVQGELVDARADVAVAHADLEFAAGGPW